MGPAPIAQLRLFSIHPTGKKEHPEKTRELQKEWGVTSCGNAQNCVQVCSKNIPLTDSIAAAGRDTSIWTSGTFMTLTKAQSTFWFSALFSRGFILFFLLTSGVGLMPDEAQYWTWSHFLDFGYYSKPPGIAWQIALGTHLFGDTELGVRFISLLVPLLSALIVVRIVVEDTGNEKTGWLAATAFLLSPIGMTGSLFATTDNGTILFWLLAIWYFTKNISQPHRFLVVGCIIAFGALWKWMIYILWLEVLLFESVIKRHEVKPFITGIALSLLGMLPMVWWNYHNDWVTFRHAASALAGTHSSRPAGNPAEFFLAGIALLSPGFLILALPSLIKRKEGAEKESFLRSIVLLVWGGLFLVSCFRKVQGNWAVAAEVILFPFVGITLHRKPAWQGWPFITACLVSIFMQALLWIGPYYGGTLLSCNPLKKAMGGDQIAGALIRAGYRPDQDFLFSDRYQSTSQTWFYNPTQQKTYFFNIHGLRHNQFSYWPGMPEEAVGKTGYFVALIPVKEARNFKQRAKKFSTLLAPYFSKLSPAQKVWLTTRFGERVRCMILIKAENYNGTAPLTPHKF